MKQNSSVEYLDFSNNSIGGGNEKTQRSTEGTTTGGMSIAQALRVNATLKKIDLQWNMLGSKVYRPCPRPYTSSMLWKTVRTLPAKGTDHLIGDLS